MTVLLLHQTGTVLGAFLYILLFSVYFTKETVRDLLTAARRKALLGEVKFITTFPEIGGMFFTLLIAACQKE